MKKLTILLCFFVQAVIAQKPEDPISLRIAPIAGPLYFVDCATGFGGGNVAASIGDDGILLVDDMFSMMHAKLLASLHTVADKPVRVVLNSHFHGDHIQGNDSFQRSAVIVAQAGTRRQLLRTNHPPQNPTAGQQPMITFTDSLSLYFNGEEIKLWHLPNGHTEGDAVIYFTGSRVLHLGDMFFFEMFPAVYPSGGGNIKQLIVDLDKVLAMIPLDAHVVPGHGRMATMKDLAGYVTMLKETVGIVEAGIASGKNLDQLKAAKVLAKYHALGDGGAQSTDEYLTMLYKLLGGKV